MLAGDLELAALLLDLAEEPRVLDGQRRLGGEGLQELDDLGGELSGRPPVDRSAPMTWSSRMQRDGQERPVARPEQDVAQMALGTTPSARMSGICTGSRRSAACAPGPSPIRIGMARRALDELRVEVVGRPQLELPAASSYS